MSNIKDKLNSYLTDILNDYGPQRVRGPKVIHDTILGTNEFYAHEIPIIDSPLLQRLRRINQVDVVSLVWPSGNHNRFEHSLGVTVIADKYVNALLKKNETRKKIQEIEPDLKSVLLHVRMAALLHDCGHGPFSHMSESIFGNLDDLRDEIEKDPKLIVTNPNPHEVMAYLIVTSDTFKQFFQKNITDEYGIDLDLDFVGEMIIGYISEPAKGFMVDIINGAFDADKLDYIQRDSHFTGVQMILDVDRLFYTIDLIDIESDIRGRNETRLTIDISGLSTIEEIVFDKMILNTTVYNHHKVRAAEGLFKSIFEKIFNERQGNEYSSAVDFLSKTDYDIYYLAKKDEEGKVISPYAVDLLNRNLPKRALVISSKTVSKDSLVSLWKVMGLDKRPSEVLEVRKQIAIYAQPENDQITYQDIWFDIPKIAKFKEGDLLPIKSEGDPKGYVTLSEIFSVDQWVKAFSQNKWKAHVFTKPKFRDAVYKASCKVIYERYGIQLNEYAQKFCKIN